MSMFISNDKKTLVKMEENKLFVSENADKMIRIELPEGRSTRERLMLLSKEYLVKNSNLNESTAEAVLSCKSEMLISELMHTLAPIFQHSIRVGENLGNNIFIYKGVVIEGGERTHLHNLMVGLQNLFGYVDNQGLWSHKAMMKYAERDTTIPYWHRYAVRALIAYSKTVPSLYIHGINELSIDELRAVYAILRRVAWEEDKNRGEHAYAN